MFSLKVDRRMVPVWTLCFLCSLMICQLHVLAHSEENNQSRNSVDILSENGSSTDNHNILSENGSSTDNHNILSENDSNTDNHDILSENGSSTDNHTILSENDSTTDNQPAERAEEPSSRLSSDTLRDNPSPIDSTSNLHRHASTGCNRSQTGIMSVDDPDSVKSLGMLNFPGKDGPPEDIAEDDQVYILGSVSARDFPRHKLMPKTLPEPVAASKRSSDTNGPHNGNGLKNRKMLPYPNASTETRDSLIASRDLTMSAQFFTSDTNNVTQSDKNISTPVPLTAAHTASLSGTLQTTLDFKNSESVTQDFLPTKIPSTAALAGVAEGEYLFKKDNPVPTEYMTSTGAEYHLVTHSGNYSNDVIEQRPSHTSVTNLLDTLMLGYDKRLRPGFGGNPLTVKADMEIRSMGPISEKDMIYSMDCYFRQVWTDRRLSFNPTREKVSNVTLNVMMLERIWRPDTIFINGGPSYVHTITTPNKFFRLSFDGTILYSQRLTIKASCPMHLEKFPMDTQQCPLHITSFGYPASDVIYEWHYGNQLAAVAANDMRLSQFDLQGMPACNITRSFKGLSHSVLTVYFDFRRHTGYFLIQVYLPCCLLVVLSWVSFWINREATADRISLGSLTMLTMTFLVLDTRNDLPRVAYSTALDVYVFMCFCFIFSSIIQFAAVHFFTKYGTAETEMMSVPDTDDEDDESVQQFDPCELSDNYHPDLQAESVTACLRKMWGCIMSTRSKRFNKNVRNALGLNSVSKIDKIARVLFPAAFCGLNIVYWMSYL